MDDFFIERRFSGWEVAKYLGIRQRSWKRYIEEGTCPPPDGIALHRVESFWYQSTLDVWVDNGKSLSGIDWSLKDQYRRRYWIKSLGVEWTDLDFSAE